MDCIAAHRAFRLENESLRKQHQKMTEMVNYTTAHMGK